ncbi:uncharacterized protein LOC135193802 [Vanessa tameamea]|uniref:Uncharacterized protein LOC135193802 n=1 Tax=Vanessa tameamea TaxID=334116 RepID=A0ABM4ARF2_VANTA
MTETQKCQHTYKIYDESCTTKIEEKDILLEQTIKFAKDIIPLTIPPSTNTISNPVYYTVKSSKQTKRKHGSCEHKPKHADVKLNEVKLKRETGVKQERKRAKGRNVDSSSRSSQNNTIDDTNENHSLCCSLSEISDQKHLKESHERKSRRKDIRKIIPSDTFEAVATEYINTNDSNIKIHLMNEKEKQLLCDSISAPVAKTMKELFLDLNVQSDVRDDIFHVHKLIETQSNKLDSVLEKLTRIENKIDNITKDQKTGRDDNFKTLKTSKLEEIGKDILNVKENFSSEEELAQVELLMKKTGKTSSVTSMATKDKDGTEDDFSKGENVPEYYKASTSQVIIKPERPNRIPARFCWTDTIKKK